MSGTNTWLKIFSGIVVNTVIVGVAAAISLSLPALRPHAVYLLPAIVAAAFIITPPLTEWLAQRLQRATVESWNEGRLISG